MRRTVYLLLAVCAFCTACGTTRRVPANDLSKPTWVGMTTYDILEKMGDPTRIDGDGKGGSILRYESTPSYDDPKYDILDPEASVGTRQYANFYLDDQGVCYRVDTNRDLPGPPRQTYASDDSDWLDILLTVSLFVLLLL